MSNYNCPFYNKYEALVMYNDPDVSEENKLIACKVLNCSNNTTDCDLWINNRQNDVFKTDYLNEEVRIRITNDPSVYDYN